MPNQNWQFELEEYIKQGEPDRAEKSEAWQTAIGDKNDVEIEKSSRAKSPSMKPSSAFIAIMSSVPPAPK